MQRRVEGTEDPARAGRRLPRREPEGRVAVRSGPSGVTAVLSPDAVLRLQRSGGNASVVSLLRTPRATEGPAHIGSQASRLVEVQRACAACESGEKEESCCGSADRAKGEEVADDQLKTKGEEVADDQIKTKGDIPVAMTIVESTARPPDDVLGKAKCPTPKKAPVGFLPAGSTSTQKAAMSACTWGITAPDALKVSTTTCKDGTDWRLRVTGVSSTVRKFSRLLPGQKEPTTWNAKKTNFCAQVTELDNLGNCPGAWYMLAAVQAHENVHVKEWKTSFPTDWPTVKATIEGISVAASGATAKQSAATKHMRTSATFTAALKTNATNFPTFWGIADPNANTDAAERKVVDPRITAICKHAKSKKWNPGGCAACVAKGIT